MDDLLVFPGGELVEKGLEDLRAAVFSEEALLVLSARFRLEGLAISVPEPANRPPSSELALYELVSQRTGRQAHAAYNSLRRRMDSFVNTYGQHLRREHRGEQPIVS